MKNDEMVDVVVDEFVDSLVDYKKNIDNGITYTKEEYVVLENLQNVLLAAIFDEKTDKGHHGMGLHVRPHVGGGRRGGGGFGGGGGGRMMSDVSPSISQSAVPSEFPKFPTSLSGLQFLKNLGGSTGAKLVFDPATGQEYVMKRGEGGYSGPDHLREEVTADHIYDFIGKSVPSLGVRTPGSKLYTDGNNGKPTKLSKFVEGSMLGEARGEKKIQAEEALKKGFVADALLGNWDVIGMGRDNALQTPDGQMIRIDNGGSLRYRAMGKPKASSAFGDGVDDIYTMRSREWNSNAASVFGDMKLNDLADQYRSISKALLTSDKKLVPEVVDIIKKTASDPIPLTQKLEKRVQALSDLSAYTDFLLNAKTSTGLSDDQIDDAGMMLMASISNKGSKNPKEVSGIHGTSPSRQIMGLSEQFMSTHEFASKGIQFDVFIKNNNNIYNGMDKKFFQRDANAWKTNHWLIRLHRTSGEMR